MASTIAAAVAPPATPAASGTPEADAEDEVRSKVQATHDKHRNERRWCPPG